MPSVMTRHPSASHPPHRIGQHLIPARPLTPISTLASISTSTSTSTASPANASISSVGSAQINHTQSYASITETTSQRRPLSSIQVNTAQPPSSINPVPNSAQLKRSPIRTRSVTKAENPAPSSTLSTTPRVLPVPEMPKPTPLSARMSVHLDRNTIDMVGGAQTGSHYSLPGHITLMLPALPSRRNRLLKEVKIKIEGRAEYFDEEGRYKPLRLFHETVVLISPSQSMIIPPVTPGKSHAPQVKVEIPFDLRIPGWLPPSHSTTLTNTSYGLVVNTLLAWDHNQPQQQQLPPLRTLPTLPHFPTSRLLRSSSRAQVADFNAISNTPEAMGMRLGPSGVIKFGNQSDASHFKVFESKLITFKIVRHNLRSALCPSMSDDVPSLCYLIPEKDSPSPLECKGTFVPIQNIHMRPEGLKLSLEFRARRDAIDRTLRKSGLRLAGTSRVPAQSSNESVGMDIDSENEDGRRDQEGEEASLPPVITQTMVFVEHLSLYVDEIETFRSESWPGFSSLFPIPAEQPSTSNISSAFLGRPTEHPHPSPDHFLKPATNLRNSHRIRQCLLAEDGLARTFRFADEGLEVSEEWRKINVVVPMPPDGLSSPAPDVDGPFCRVKHRMVAKVVCRIIDLPTERKTVSFQFPIRFATSPQTMPENCSSSWLFQKPTLPPYVQLFHENGDPKDCDPLPLYSQYPARSTTPTGDPVPKEQNDTDTQSTSLSVPIPSYSLSEPSAPHPYSWLEAALFPTTSVQPPQSCSIASSLPMERDRIVSSSSSSNNGSSSASTASSSRAVSPSSSTSDFTSPSLPGGLSGSLAGKKPIPTQRQLGPTTTMRHAADLQAAIALANTNGNGDAANVAAGADSGDVAIAGI